MNIKLMDSSVRDGGNVNDWLFGEATIHGIINNLQKAKIDVIEIGYLKNVEFNRNKTLYNKIEEAKINLPYEREANQKVSLMVQVDKWDWSNIEQCDGIVDIIRVSFHKTKIEDGMRLSKIVMEHGFECHCNPINIMGYTDIELLQLIEKINEVHPKVFTIVDTFGSMDLDDLRRLDALLDNNLLEDIEISVHLHENLGLAFSLALEFMSFFESKRNIYIDSSVLGIGRVPGNLCQELVVDYLNKHKNASYDIDYIYDTIDDYIVKIKANHPWGYAVPYALSATYNLHRTYPEFLLEQGKLRTKDIRYILNSIRSEEKVIYNEKYIRELYNDYMDVNIDDSNALKELKNILYGKRIFLIAPGKSIQDRLKEIQECVSEDNTVSISINFIPEFCEVNYYFFTNFRRIKYSENVYVQKKAIITSNLIKDKIDAAYIMNFSRLSTFDDIINADSTLCFLHLLKMIGINEVYIAGFDGFKGKEDHFDNLYDGISDKSDNNRLVLSIIEKKFKDFQIHHITPSVYEKIS